MTLTGLIKFVAKATGYDAGEVALILKTAIAYIGGRLLSTDDEVKITGLGTFYWHKRRQTQRRHPITGIQVAVPERLTLRFRPAAKLRFKEMQDGEAWSRDESREDEGS